MQYGFVLISRAERYLAKLPPDESIKIMANIRKMAEGNLSAVETKQLIGPIRELKVGNHRIPYFLIGSVLHFTSGFQKKSAKTPKTEILYAQKLYRLYKDQN